jgi:hypothetical protein
MLNNIPVRAGTFRSADLGCTSIACAPRGRAPRAAATRGLPSNHHLWKLPRSGPSPLAPPRVGVLCEHHANAHVSAQPAQARRAVTRTRRRMIDNGYGLQAPTGSWPRCAPQDGAASVYPRDRARRLRGPSCDVEARRGSCNILERRSSLPWNWIPSGWTEAGQWLSRTTCS